MSYEWIDPTPGNSCPTCNHFAGHAFPDGQQLPLPAHPGCECFYIYTDAPGAAINWDEQPDHARDTYTYYAAWILRQGDELPPSLQPLQPAAEAYNKSKEPAAMNQQTRLLAYAPPTAVDTQFHILHGVAIVQAVEALGHGFLIDDIALHQINDLGQAARNGIKSRFTHPGLSSDGLGKFLGRVKDFRVVGDKVLGDLHLSAVASKSPHGDLRAYVEELAATDPEAFGMSVVITGRRVWELEDGRTIEAEADDAPPANATSTMPLFRVHSLDAVDAVDEPAANRDGFFANTTSTLAAHIFDRLDTLLQSLNIQPALYPKLLGDYINGRPIPAPLSALIDELTADYDIQPDKAKSFAAQYAFARLSRPVSLGAGVITLTAVAGAAPGLPQQGAFTMSGLTPDPVTLPETAVTNPASTADAWMQSIQQTAVSARLSNSGLPQRVRERLAQATYATPEALDAAISQAREELAEIAQASVVDFGGQSPRISGMRTDLDRAQSNVDWFFGVDGAEAPEYNLRRFDQLYVALTGDVNFTGLFDRARAELSASPVTLPDLALNAMNKVVIQQFSLLAFWRWYEKVAVPTPNDGSLQDMAWISLGGTGNLPLVADGGAYTEGNIGDVRENDAFGKYGRYVGITRAMIKNSDIQRIQAVAKALAIDSVRTRSANIAAIFTQASGTGPTLDQDATVLFHANHSNVATTALGTSVSAWEAASLECFNGLEVGSGKKIGTFAKYLLVPSALYFQGLANFGYGDGYPTAYNPHAIADRSPEDPRPQVLAVPDWTDATDWAYLADPRIFPVIHMSYSADPSGRTHPLPELFSVVSETAGMMFTNDTLPIKVRDEYAFGVNGYRGIGKRNVA